MNKLIKLPLFLGIVGGICGGLLAGTYLITSPVIQKAEEARIAAAYKEHFEACEKVEEKEIKVAPTEKGVSISKVVYAYDGSSSYLGNVYTVSAKGYGGNLTFTASIANNKISKVIMVSANESNVGFIFLENLKNQTNFTIESLADIRSGSSDTYKAVVSGLNACYADYQVNQGGN